jgi:hypothetical protein
MKFPQNPLEGRWTRERAQRAYIRHAAKYGVEVVFLSAAEWKKHLQEVRRSPGWQPRKRNGNGRRANGRGNGHDT